MRDHKRVAHCCSRNFKLSEAELRKAELSMSIFAVMSATAYPYTIHSFPTVRVIQTFKTVFLSEEFKTQINLKSWDGVVACWKCRFLLPYFTSTGILTEHCPQERMINNQLPGSHKLDLIYFSCSYGLPAIITSELLKNSTAMQDRWPLPWKYPTDQYMNYSLSHPAWSSAQADFPSSMESDHFHVVKKIFFQDFFGWC